jgi:hypothetical protein
MKSGSQRYRIYVGVTYAVLVALLVASVVLIELSPGNAAVQRYGPNAAAELGGILITVLLVERLLAWQRHRAAEPARRVALRHMWRALNRLSHMLLFAYKAAAPPGSPQPVELHDLLEAWKSQARYLDFHKPYGPDGPPRTWLVFAAEVADAVSNGLQDVIDRYRDVLTPELVAAVDDLVDHPVFAYMSMGRTIEQIDHTHGFTLPPALVLGALGRRPRVGFARGVRPARGARAQGVRQPRWPRAISHRTFI